LLFAAAAWGGTVIAAALCTGRTPFADGPAPIPFARWPFAAIGGCTGFGLALHGDSAAHLALLLVIALALAGCSAADLEFGLLPDVLTLVPLALLVALGAAAHDGLPALGAAFVALPFAAAAVASRGRGMGWGDVKLAALGGALLGAHDATLALMLASFAAYIITRATRTSRPVAFGPYLAGSIALTLAITRTI
jgi:prepilin signal peptidase PulO-like enzyme (type II secretory pathway)